MSTLDQAARVSEREAREVAEAAREEEWGAASFVRDLFAGRLRLGLIDPYPQPDPEDEARARPFLEALEAFLREKVDGDEIDRTHKVPDAVVDGLRRLGAFGIKIPREYGGLGLSQHSYTRAIRLVSSVDGSLTALLSAHQSIGVPQPLKLFGSEDQKQRYFPRLARGAISAFALTESGVGSDPAAMETTAVLAGAHVARKAGGGGRRGDGRPLLPASPAPHRVELPPSLPQRRRPDLPRRPGDPGRSAPLARGRRRPVRHPIDSGRVGHRIMAF